MSHEPMMKQKRLITLREAYRDVGAGAKALIKYSVCITLIPYLHNASPKEERIREAREKKNTEGWIGVCSFAGANVFILC